MCHFESPMATRMLHACPSVVTPCIGMLVSHSTYVRTYGHTNVRTYVVYTYVRTQCNNLLVSLLFVWVCMCVCPHTYVLLCLCLHIDSVPVCLPLLVKVRPRRPSVQKTSRRPLASTTLPLTATLSSPPSHPEGVVRTQERPQRSLEDHHDSVPPTYREVLEKDQRDKLRQSIAGRYGVRTYIHTY